MAYAADRTPLELTALTSLASDDTIIVGDTSDVSEVAKSITKANLVTDLTTNFATAAQGSLADSALQSFTETDPVVGAINGLVKANGAGTISAAVSGTDYAPALGADDNYVTDAEKVVIGNTSGTNSGDQTSIVGITGTKAQYDTSVTDGDFMYIGDAPTAHTHLLAAGATDVTATAAEVNILDGVTATTAELNFVDGVTSNVQTQLNAKAPTAAPTFTGDTTVADLQVTGEFGADAEVDDGNSSTADTINWTTGNFHKSTMTGNCTYTFTAPTYVGRYQLMLVQDATGSRIATWPAAVKWPGGTAPTLTTTAAGIDIITFYWDGSSYYAVDSLAFA